MITYRDRSFCAQSECAKFDGCPTAATNKVREQAKALDLPISLMKFIDCFEPNYPEIPDGSIVETDNGEKT